MLRQCQKYITVLDILRGLQSYKWNIEVLCPTSLLNICAHKGIEYTEQPLGDKVNGVYRIDNGLPSIVINSQLSATGKWFALACKISNHFTTEPVRARALGSIAILPTWMLREYSFEQLEEKGYSWHFLRFRQEVAALYPQIPRTKYPWTKDITHIQDVLT